MDGSSVEHSDSDSGESWTMLDRSPGDRSPTHVDLALDSPDTPTRLAGESVDPSERDDDTDGISIISESENESVSLEMNNYELVQSVIKVSGYEEPPSAAAAPVENLVKPTTAHSSEAADKPIKEPDDMLDSRGRMKTYVHRRNQRLSTVLNIIVLGSVITAAGVAIGHMWGVRDDCSALQGTQSVNKILSNLYKLQEENAYLRSKLKELTLINNVLAQPRRSADQRPLTKQRCKKVFEESLTGKSVGRATTKCVDFDPEDNLKELQAHFVQPPFEKDFVSDVDKLKSVYLQNRSWLDDEVAKRLETEKINLKTFKDKVEDHRSRKSAGALKEDAEITVESVGPDYDAVNTPPEKATEDIMQKITYAESLMSDRDAGNKRKRSIEGSEAKERPSKKLRKLNETVPSDSDAEVTKDDRYRKPRVKDAKRRDRQKGHRRDKRRDKYQQWAMKGGYVKDYDDVSLSSQDSNRQAEPEHRQKGEKKKKGAKGDKSVGTDGWFEMRAARSAARRHLELELFDAPSAGWYFRRGRRREQSRGKGDASKHATRPAMNYKSKR